MNSKKLLFFLVIIGLPYLLNAQQRSTITGTVISLEDDIPIPGVNVLILGTQRGTTTDFDGNYSIEAAPNEVITFSFTGKKTVTIDVGNQSVINVSLEEEAAQLEQVVVIGYGTQKKSSLTGSVAKFENENLDELPYSDISSGIKGKIAGVQIRNTSANVGDDPQILVRGIGSISIGQSPLVVVDGFPFDDGLQFINPSTIESIEVLKDASSTAIYGSRGGNGVILITTKDGQENKTSYELKTFSGFKRAFREVDILDAVEFSDLALQRDQLQENFNAAQDGRDPVLVNYDAIDIGKRTIAENIGGTTNWQEEALRDPARIESYQFNIFGGSRKSNYFISTRYVYDEGIRKDNDLERINLQAKLKSTLSDNVTFNLKINPTYTILRRSAINFTDVSRYQTWIPVRHNEYTSQLTGQPVGSFAHAVHFQNLSFDFIDRETGEQRNTGVLERLWTSSNFNPISGQEESRRNQFDYRLVTDGSVTWKINKNLKLRSSLGGYFQYRTQEEFFGRDSDRRNQNEGILADRLRVKYINENTLNYSKNFNGHELDLLAGITYENEQFRFTNIRYTEFPVENVTTLNGGTIVDQPNTNTLKYSTVLSSYLGRINYAYDDRYLLSIVGRADGFSRFGERNKYGIFPSASVGWNIANENFWKNSIGNTVNQFKLRSSYGISGSNAIAITDYPALDLLFPSNYSLGTGGGTLQPGFGEINNVQGNPSLSWETTLEWNNGVDLGLFNGSLYLTVDYYYKVSEDLILRQPISNISGNDELFNNIGKIQNSGLEFDLSTNHTRGKFTWQSSANISFNRNKLISFGGSERVISNGERTDQYLTRVGDPYIQYFGYRTDGIFQDQEDLDNSPRGIDDAVGGLKRVDVNGDGVIDPNDRTVIGDPFPDFIWGFTTDFKYGNWDLNLSFQGSQGGEIVYGEAFYAEVEQLHRYYVEGQWFSPDIPASRPAARVGVPWLETDYAVQDASYASLREVVLGYSLPANAASRLGLEKMRIYVTGQNLWYQVADDYLGLNPEGITDRNNVLITGYQRGVSPVQRQIGFGIDVNF